MCRLRRALQAQREELSDRRVQSPSLSGMRRAHHVAAALGVDVAIPRSQVQRSSALWVRHEAFGSRSQTSSPTEQRGADGCHRYISPLREPPQPGPLEDGGRRRTTRGKNAAWRHGFPRPMMTMRGPHMLESTGIVDGETWPMLEQPGWTPQPTPELVSLRCPACDAARCQPVGPVPDHEYAVPYVATYTRCLECETVFQSPMPRESDLAAFYPSSYHSMTIDGWLMNARRAMRVSRLKKLFPRSSGVVLDYGCGNGSFLVTAARKLPQLRYVGFEYSDTREQQELAGGKVLLIRGAPSDLLAAVPSIDVLIMNHVIEHLPDPFATLEPLFQRLNPGGLFDGQTPNADSLEHKLFGESWSGYHAPRHTVVFSRQGLGALLRRRGFGQIDIRGAFNPAGVAVSLASLSHNRRPGMVVRSGLAWHAFVAAGAALMPIDLLSRAPGMIDFCARKVAR
jgi:SAM-dependent methyltransferase